MDSFPRLLIVPLLLAAAAAQTQPRIFYSDLESGPNSGGQNDRGAFVTIYGSGFGGSRGNSTVSIGGGLADKYPVWSNQKICFQLGHAARSGDIIVNVEGVGASNGIRFTVRKGNIYFVGPTGKDSSGGSFSAPWKTVNKAAEAMAFGDIAYVMDGVEQTGTYDYNASVVIASAGASDRPKALVSYPDAKVVIGSVNGPEFGVRTPSISGGPFSHWTIAGFTLRGGNQALDVRLVTDWRIVGNDISCPNGDGGAACVEVAASTNIKFLGNVVHDTGKAGGSKLYHSVYFTTDSNHIEVGWDQIANNHSCRGIQFHSSPDGPNSGFNQYDLVVHDNVVHGQVCDGINFATVDPSKGAVIAYNNLVYDVGRGPDPPDGESNYACISSPGITNVGPPGKGVVEWYNNTLYDCGARGGPDAGAFNAGSGPTVRLRNNLVLLKRTENYLEPGGSVALFSGSNNLWFGAKPNGHALTLSIQADPKVISAGSDFHLQAGSPAIDSGVNTEAATDLDGNVRPQGKAFDIGAFELPSIHAARSTSKFSSDH